MMINELGLDTIEVGGSLGIAMEGGIISFGDAESAKQLVKEIEKDSLLGKVLGNGADITGKVLGVERVATVKNQMMPAYEPRAIKGHGVTFATSPMGADHTAGMTIREGLEPTAKEGQVEISKKMQLLSMLYDSLGLCLFVHVAVRDRLELVRDMVNSLHGESLTIEDLWKIAQESLRKEVNFNRKAGLNKATDRLPEIFNYETLPSSNTVFDIEADKLDAITEW